MKTILEKIERKATQWVNTLDEQLQQPIVHIVSGEVFTHGGALSEHVAGEPIAQPTTTDSNTPKPGTPEMNVKPPLLLPKAKVLPQS